jgi:hypothetical protein
LEKLLLKVHPRLDTFRAIFYPKDEISPNLVTLAAASFTGMDGLCFFGNFGAIKNRSDFPEWRALNRKRRIQLENLGDTKK